ncbi:hypothetical protein EBS80_00020 [bacterium]|nr:hypothetical protein [bacterium]
MRVLILLAGLLSGCLLTDPDGDGKAGLADCDPNRAGACVTPDPEPEPDTGDPCDPVSWFADEDGDGVGDGVSTEACDTPGDGFVTVSGDCDDGDATVSPNAAEICNGVDDNCDGVTDDDAVNKTTWVLDADNDEYGDPANVVVACAQPGDDFSPDLAATDCDDGDVLIHPGATEFCDGIDNDCNGVVDPDTAYDASTWIVDADGDGYGDAALSASQKSCAQPDGFVGNAGDCDDANAAASPAASEIDGNSVDDDCDGEVDEGADCYRDADGDGYGDPTNGRFADSGECAEGYVTNSSDCDDANYTVNPGIVYDDSYDGTDADCDSYED